MPVYPLIDELFRLGEYVAAGFSVGKKYVGCGFSRPERRIVVTIFSTRHIHPDAVTYFCDDARTYEAVEDAACGICGNLERLAQPIDRHDGFGFVDNEVHYTARDRRTPRVIPSVNSTSDQSARAIPRPREGHCVSTRFPLSGPRFLRCDRLVQLSR